MNDLEICRRVADIEGVHYMETKYEKDNFLVLASKPDGSGTPPEIIGGYNPLADNALCFKLMVKYGLSFDPARNGKFYTAFYGSELSECRSDKNPNRAICLAIIEAHNDTNI